MPDSLTLTLSEEQSKSLLTHGHLKRQVLIVKPGMRHALSPDSTDPALKGGYGLYTVEFTLQPPYRIVPDKSQYETQPDVPGGSLLRISSLLPDGEGHIEIKSYYRPTTLSPLEEVEYKFFPNSEGCLEKIKATLRAENFYSAEAKAWGSLAPLLSKWAFAHDVPLDIARLRLEEVRTGIYMSIHLRLPYEVVDCDAQLLGFYSVPQIYHPLTYYREALNSLSPLYQFLCYFKVIELMDGLQIKELKLKFNLKDKTELFVLNGNIQDDQWLKKNLDPDIYDQIIGKSIAHAVHSILRIPRNRIAHAFLDKDPHPHNRDAEELLNFNEIYDLLPLVKYIARRMIAREMRLTI